MFHNTSGTEGEIRAEEMKVIESKELEAAVADGWRMLGLIDHQDVQRSNQPTGLKDQFGADMYFDSPIIFQQARFLMGRGKATADYVARLKEGDDALYEAKKELKTAKENLTVERESTEHSRGLIERLREKVDSDKETLRKLEEGIGVAEARVGKVSDAIGSERMKEILGDDESAPVKG